MSYPHSQPIVPRGRKPFGTGLLILAATLLTACGPGGGGPPPDMAIEVAVSRPDQLVVEDTLPAVGTIEPDERVVLQPKVSGLIQSIHFKEGQRVQQGDLLFRLDADKETALQAQAQAERDLALANLERAQTLAGSRAISRQELDQLAGTLAVRDATLELETRRLEERLIRAPFDGILGPREVSEGQYVNAGQSLVTLVQDAVVKVEFRIPERQLGRLRIGQLGRLSVSAYPHQTFEGTISLVHPEVDLATRTIGARLVVLNPDGHLRPGMFARVDLVLGQREGALVVPESALIPALDSFSVYLVEEERARLRPVKLGVRLPGRVELREGLTPDSVVIVSGTQKLVDGIRVTPVQDAAETLAARRQDASPDAVLH